VKRTVSGITRVWLSLVCVALAGTGAAVLATVRAAEAPNSRGGTSKQLKQAAEPLRPQAEQETAQNPDLPGPLVTGGEVDMGAYLVGRQDHIDALQGLPYSPPKGQANPRLDAIRQLAAAEKAQRDRLATLGLAPPDWLELGPRPIPNGQTPNPGGNQVPVSGRTISIAVHPTNPDIAYVGTAQGGLYRTLDGGQTWKAIFDSAASLAVGAVALAPSNPSILYVGTGENGLSGDSFFGVGLYRIDNADTTADLVGPINPLVTTGIANTTAFTGRAISEILVHPTDPATIFVGTSSGIGGLGATAIAGTVPPLAIRGLYRSTNATAALGAVAFEKLTITPLGSVAPDTTGNGNVMDMVFEPGNPNVLVASVFGIVAGPPSDGGVYRTANALDPTPVFTRTLAVTPTGVRTELAVNSVGGTVTMIAATGESAAGTACAVGSGKVYRSVDSGQTWTLQQGGGGFCGGQCFYDIAVALDPTDANIVHLGGAAPGACSVVYERSTDGGAAFTRLNEGLHPDTHAITVAPSDHNIVYMGNDGGIFKSEDGGLTWTSLNNSMFGATQFMGLAIHPIDREFLIGGTQDNGTNFRRPDGNWFRADFGDGGYAVIDQNAVDTRNVTMYHTYFNQTNAMGFSKVTDVADATEGNWTFYGCGFGGSIPNGLVCTGITAIQFYAPMSQGPGNPNTLYFGSDRVFRSANAGVNMSLVSQAPLHSGFSVTAIGISPQDDNVRLMGVRSGRVFATTTGSTPLVDVTGPWPTNALPTEQPRRFVSRLTVDPNDPDTAYVSFATYCGATPACAQVYKTTTLGDLVAGTGGSWAPANAGIPDTPVSAFVVDPRNPNSLFAGSDIGVFHSADGGATWSPYGTGLPRVAVFDMKLHSPTGTLRVATHGRGIWEIRANTAQPAFSELSSVLLLPGESPVEVSGRIRAGSITPPGSVSITLEGQTQFAIIEPTDGRFSTTFDTSSLAVGRHSIAYSYSGVPGDYEPTAGSGTVTVVSALAPTATGVDAPTITFPADGVVTVDVTSPAGTVGGVVMLSVDAGSPLTQTLSGGSATFTLPSPSGGAHALNVTYPRQMTFERSSASGVLLVNKASPVFASLLPAFVSPGQTPAVLTGTLLVRSAAPSGNVSATVNGVSQATPIADDGSFLIRFDSASLAPGRYEVTYGYAGDASFNSASATSVLSVVPAVTTVFMNPAPITIPDNAPAVPYPSTIEVSGLGEAVVKASVTLTGVTHTFLGDVEMVLVAPDGSTTTLFWDPNNNSANVSGANYTFDDGGPPLPPSSGSGTYRPTQTSAPPNLPAAAPAGPYGTVLFTTNRARADGTWSLYIADRFGQDSGSISGGWSLALTTAPIRVRSGPPPVFREGPQREEPSPIKP
jgi:photosystem II stability/assembly factor-like uncharacterized protein/subtilisin-like proprotein convertase family protein